MFYRATLLSILWPAVGYFRQYGRVCVSVCSCSTFSKLSIVQTIAMHCLKHSKTSLNYGPSRPCTVDLVVLMDLLVIIGLSKQFKVHFWSGQWPKLLRFGCETKNSNIELTLIGNWFINPKWIFIISRWCYKMRHMLWMHW